MKRLVFSPTLDQSLDQQLVTVLEPVVGRPVSLPEAARLVFQGSVYRNKVRVKDSGPPSTSEPLEVFWPDLAVEEFTLDPARVVWQDEHLVVIDKPARVNTAPSPFSDIDCLTWGVQKWLGGGFAVHAIHRLDRDTRGLIFFAKHKEAERALHQMFRERSVRKVYRALTAPVVLAEGQKVGRVYRWKDTLEFRGKVQAAATTAIRSGTTADGLWSWTVLAHTGRPHQIRKHFARYLVPLWGDRAYGTGEAGPEVDLGLACVAYRFRHPLTDERLEVTLDLT